MVPTKRGQAHHLVYGLLLTEIRTYVVRLSGGQGTLVSWTRILVQLEILELIAPKRLRRRYATAIRTLARNSMPDVLVRKDMTDCADRLAAK
ncbi:MAG: hypothetical protein PHI63_06110 [Patescibacteria group bacterium]|nr:hypothetical protein [Patescibacteria group bacterium]